MKIFTTLKVWAIKRYAAHKAKFVYPENIKFDLNEVINRISIKVAIIDDVDFPWNNALIDGGYEVDFFSDYTKPTKNTTKKPITVDLKGYDIILCDIHKVGTLVYPGSDGIGVLKKLRKDFPFHVIAAYTGNPELTITRLPQNLLDGVFPKELGLDDFLLNLNHLANIYKIPKDRWFFLKKRLQYLNVPEEHETRIRQTFVEYTLACQYLKKSRVLDKQELLRISTSHEEKINLIDVAKYGITAGKIVTAIIPFISDAGK